MTPNEQYYENIVNDNTAILATNEGVFQHTSDKLFKLFKEQKNMASK